MILSIRYLQNHPNNNWDQLKAELTARFSEITDSQHAFSLLRAVKQKPSESVQVYAERLLSLAQDAFAGAQGRMQAVEPQLIGFFTDGLSQDPIKFKVMRDAPNTLQGAIQTAMMEQNLRKRFELRTSRSRSYGGASNDVQPMEIDHMRRSNKCYKCGRSGHKAKECRTRHINLVESFPRRRTNQEEERRCYHCNQQGHLIRNCPHWVNYQGGNNPRPNPPRSN